MGYVYHLSMTPGDFSQKPKRHPIKLAQQSSGTSELNEILKDEKTDSVDWRPSSQIGNSDLGLSSASKSTSSRNQNIDDDMSTNRSLSFAMVDNSNSLAPVPLLNGRLPNSDAEFAAIMGILGDADLDSLKEVRSCGLF